MAEQLKVTIAGKPADVSELIDHLGGGLKRRIVERTAAGRAIARKLLKTTGKTQNGKTSLGRPVKHDCNVVNAWRVTNKASVTVTAEHFGIGTATVKRYCRAAAGVKP